ncbi:MAG: alpha-L-arabinofuranosidase C-terminal domain-containing protein, partial [Armatimonadota bacterium]
MRSYILKRLLLIVPTLPGITVVTFAIIQLAPGKEAGIVKQDARLGIKPTKYVVRAILKQKGLAGGVTLALRQGRNVYASALIPQVAEDWSQYTTELDVRAEDPNAQFSVSAVGPGTLWIGCLSLMPADNVDGMRKDVLEAIRRIKPPLIRWPGGNMVSGYHWEDGIGDRDRRMPRWERAWNAWEWNDFGTDEYIQFCRLVGTEPYICVNAGEGQADEAARWVEYCNGSPSTPYGKLRAANGHPEPYRVKYWGIGNEMYGDWQLGHLDATKYALKSIEFARAMKAVDPSIVLVGVGVDHDSYGNWNSTVSQIAGSYYDYLSVHYYKGPREKDPPELTYLNLICASLEIEKMLAATADVVDRNSPKKLPLALDEWNIWLPNGLESSIYALRDGLFAAGVFHAMHRLSDRVTMANLAQLVNVLGAIQTSATEIVETPIYKAFELYSNLCEQNRV